MFVWSHRLLRFVWSRGARRFFTTCMRTFDSNVFFLSFLCGKVLLYRNQKSVTKTHLGAVLCWEESLSCMSQLIIVGLTFDDQAGIMNRWEAPDVFQRCIQKILENDFLLTGTIRAFYAHFSELVIKRNTSYGNDRLEKIKLDSREWSSFYFTL